MVAVVGWVLLEMNSDKRFSVQDIYMEVPLKSPPVEKERKEAGLGRN